MSPPDALHTHFCDFCNQAAWESESKRVEIPESGYERVQKVFWTQGAKVSQESLAPSETCFAPVQPYFVPVQETFRSLGPKDLLHPLVTTFGKFLFSTPSPNLSQAAWFAMRVVG